MACWYEFVNYVTALYIVDLKYPKFEIDLFDMLLPYTSMQCGRVFPEEKKKLNNHENKYI